MSEPKWTSGPWKASVTEPPGQFVIHSQTAMGPGEHQMRTVAYCKEKADADLIVAALDMYAALEFIFDHIADKERTSLDLYPALGLDAGRALEMARAALAKARGGTIPITATR